MTPGANKIRFWKSMLAGLSGAGWLGLFATAAVAQTVLTPTSLPLYFEAQSGQTDSPKQFLARGHDAQFLISPDTVQFTLCKMTGSRAFSARTAQMQFVGANESAQISGTEKLSGKINYLIGNEPARWRTGVATFARVQVGQLYPGVSLIYYGNQRQLEYDFTVAPGANPDVIAIHFSGADKISIDPAGELAVNLSDGEVRQPRPVIYQSVNGARQAIGGGYKILDGHTVAFAIGNYNHNLPLVIDPVLSYSTYFGGGSDDIAWKVAVDTNGFVYVAGQTLSANLATAGAFQTNLAGGSFVGDAFVAKFNNDGSNLVYCTYLGGSDDDLASSLAVDNAGDVFLTGFTDSPNFPTNNALFPKMPGYNYGRGIYNGSGFVAELDPTGAHLVYSTYLGGSGFVGNAVTPGSGDQGTGIAVDSAGNTYVTGYTTSTNFPVVNPLVYQLSGTNNTFSHLAGLDNAFLAVFGPGGTNLLYSTYFGGSGIDVASGIAVDGAGNVYLAGSTDSTNFPTKNPVQLYLGGVTNVLPSYDAFVARFAPPVTNFSLVYSTFLGGTNDDFGNDIAVDAAGDAFVTGGTASPNFPDTVTNLAGLSNGMTNNLVYGYNVTTNAFLTQIIWNGANAAIGYSAVFGGTNLGIDAGYGVAADSAGDAFVVGASSTTNFPAVNVPGLLSATNAGDSDAFVIAFNANCSDVLYSGYLGGADNDYGYSIAVDSQTNAYIVGQTASANFPVFNARQSSLNGPSDAFLAQIGWISELPQITTQPTNQTTEVGASVSFSVTATGTPPLSYQWQVQGTNLMWTNLVDGDDTSGSTNATLTFSDAQTTNSGNYQVVVANYAGSVTSAVVVLTVTNVAPVITGQPQSQTVGVGSTANFTVYGQDGTLPELFQWFKDGVELTNGITAWGSTIDGATNSATLTIYNAQTNDDGAYQLVVSNGWGVVATSNAILTVAAFPTIVTPPADQTVGLGSTVTFAVTAAGTGPLSYQWLENGTNLTDGSNSSGSSISGSTTATMTLNNAQTNDDGGYSVIVTNSLGSVTSSPPAILTVLTVPTFTGITVSTNGTFILSGAGGTNGGTYIVLTSTNLATPLNQWSPINAYQFDSEGQFTFTNMPPTNTPQRFYRLQLPSP